MTMGPTRDLGPCIAEWGGTSLGRTNGGVTFRYSEEDANVVEDQLGTDPVDKIIVGAPVEVEVPLTRMSLASLSSVLAGSSGSGTSGSTMTVKSATGTSRYDRAEELVLKPVLENGSADPTTSRWLHIYKASPRANFEIIYDNANQRIYNVVFDGFPDQSGTGPLYRKWGVGPDI